MDIERVRTFCTPLYVPLTTTAQDTQPEVYETPDVVRPASPSTSGEGPSTDSIDRTMLDLKSAAAEFSEKERFARTHKSIYCIISNVFLI